MNFDELIEEIKNQNISIEEIERQLINYKKLKEINIYSILWLELIKFYLRKYGYIDYEQL